MTPKRITTNSSQHGFNLVEVMIALVVLAIGLLGLAALQNFSLKATHQSYQRTQATILIHEILDRMRANPTGARAGSYVIATTDNVAGPDCAVAACTSAFLALHDLREWTAAMRSPSGLGPSGRVSIASAPFGGGVLTTVSLTWLEGQGQISTTGGTSDPIQMTQSMTAQLP